MNTTFLEKMIIVCLVAIIFLALLALFRESQNKETEELKELYDIHKFVKNNQVVIVLEDKVNNKKYFGVKYFNLIEIEEGGEKTTNKMIF